MKNLAIQAENISKQYRLGQVGTGTLSHDLNRFWSKIRGKEDPYLKIGEINDRSVKGESEYVWSLREINFEIEQGDAVGIIGRNGAGKSTLLKLLSKVTQPTTGSFKVNGRIASLLEVGTGFNPEMSGRENIYLNGAILGMRRIEITRKLDEIIAFSGVERYIDTPVKRYSSGMYVRLAFAVAAHLESEILIVDEVLAVGDAEFQRKCLGKMNDVSKGEGRTVLFVSHNMASIQSLCQKGIILEKGQIIYKGEIESAIQNYILSTKEYFSDFQLSERKVSKDVYIKNVYFTNENDQKVELLVTGRSVKIIFEIFNSTDSIISNLDIGLGIFNLTDNMLLALKSNVVNKTYNFVSGLNKISCIIPKFPLTNGNYKYNINITGNNITYDWVKDAGYFEVENGLFYDTGKVPALLSQIVLIEHSWE
jgi:lipopolysaccharide transport system ATP-binding protein